MPFPFFLAAPNVADSITELGVCSKWEKRRQQTEIYQASLYILPGLCCAAAGLHVSTNYVTAIGHLEWLNCSHCLSPWSGPLDLRELLCLTLRFLPISSTSLICHRCLFLRHTTWGDTSPVQNLPDCGPKSESQRVTYKSQFMLCSLPSPPFPHFLGLEEVGFPLALCAYSKFCPCWVYSKLLAPWAWLLC